MDNSFDNRQQALAGLGLIAAEMAHEVRTPIHVLKERLSLLLSTPAKDIEDEIQKMVSLCNHVLEITKTIQNIGKTNQATPLLPLDICRLVHDAKDFFKNKFFDENIDFSFNSNGKIIVNGNRFQLLQVIMNLFKNSCEAMKTQTSKKITVDIISEDTHIFIRISDNGPGINEKIRKELMKPFNSTKSNEEGNGLGLHISRQIMMAHDGDLLCDPSESGAIFRLRLPALTLSE